jgi:hypothetical protein
MRAALEDIVAWLVAPSTVATPEELFTGLSERLCAAGLALQRGSTSLMTKHPDVFGRQLIWARGAGTQGILRSHAVIASSMYADSPAAHVRRTGQPLRGSRRRTIPRASRCTPSSAPPG